MWKSIIFVSYLAHCVISQTITPLNVPVIDSAISPVWDEPTQSLYFVNLPTKEQPNSLFRYSYRSGVLHSAHIKGVNAVSFIIPVKPKCKKTKNLFLIGVGRKVLTVKWNGKCPRAKIVKKLFTMDANIPHSRTSLARASPNGRFYGGTYFKKSLCSSNRRSLSLYRYDEAGLVCVAGNLSSTSGIAFNEKEGKLYHLDTCQLIITKFDANPQTGDIWNGQTIFDFRNYADLVSLNYPLGLEIDSNGLLYTLQPQSVWVIDPWTSSLVKRIKFNAPVLNGVAFGGPNRDILYVVAGSNYVNPFTTETVADPTNTTTSLYAVTQLGVVGNPVARFTLP